MIIYKDLLIAADHVLSEARSIQLLICTFYFKQTYISAVREQKELVENYVQTHNLKDLKKWLRNHRSIDEYTRIELIQLGKMYGIKNYCRLSKEVLAYEIKQIMRMNDPNIG